ncbi:MAG TPA: hypothetical protein VFE60_17975, partial [Roseiarcus sp.]|nr:hypothetical protein [Roseiarcus sp.]
MPEGALHRPALTTVVAGAREIGEEAARLLPRGVKSSEGPPESIILPPKVILVEVAAQDQQPRKRILFGAKARTRKMEESTMKVEVSHFAM